MWKGLRHPHRRSWLLFLGDSDTRSLVLELLQLIVAGQHGAAVAANDTLPWLGTRHVADASHSTGRLSRDERNDWLRRCFLDFTYSRRGTLLASRSLYCHQGATHAGKGGYITFGRDYNLSTSEEAASSNGDVEHSLAGSLRVTFVGVEALPQTEQTLSSLTNALSVSVSAGSETPTALYVGVGAWYHDKNIAADSWGVFANKLTNSLNRVAALLSPPRALTFGTIIGQWNRFLDFDAYIVPRLREQSRWHILNRSTPLSWMAAVRYGVDTRKPGLYGTGGHASPLVNYVDLQRLMAANAFGGTRDETPEDACNSIPARVQYSPWCAGMGQAVGGNSFMEAYFHFCNVTIYSRGTQT